MDQKKEQGCVHQCMCPCHEEGVLMMHIMACCEGKCEICGKHIKRGQMEEHLQTCHKKSD